MSETDRLLEAGLADYLKATFPDDTHLGPEVQAKLAERARPRTRRAGMRVERDCCWMESWGPDEWLPLSVVLMVMMAIAFGAIVGAGSREARRMVMFVSVLLGGVVAVQRATTDGIDFGPAAAVMITIGVGVIGMLLIITLVDTLVDDGGGGGIDDDPLRERTPPRRER